MLAKINMSANSEVGQMAAMIGAVDGDDEEELKLDPGAVFHMPHTRAGMTTCKKASPGTTVEVADGIILPVDGLGTIVVDLDQPGTTTKPVKIAAVAYVPGLSRNLLSARKAVQQWGELLTC